MGTGNNHRGTRQSSRTQVPEESPPTGPSSAEVIRRPKISRYPLAFVDAGSEQTMTPDGPCAFADLQHQRIRGRERVRPVIKRVSSELFDPDIQTPGYFGDLRLLQPLIPSVSTSLAIQRADTPNLIFDVLDFTYETSRH